jgi:hypothetical protein
MVRSNSTAPTVGLPSDLIDRTGRLPSQLPWAKSQKQFHNGKCPDCYDTGMMSVTLWGVRDGDRYTQVDEPCHCGIGAKSVEYVIDEALAAFAVAA